MEWAEKQTPPPKGNLAGRNLTPSRGNYYDSAPQQEPPLTPCGTKTSPARRSRQVRSEPVTGAGAGAVASAALVTDRGHQGHHEEAKPVDVQG